MTAPGQLERRLEQYLGERYGSPSALIIRDPESNSGLREWRAGDTEALCRWIDGGSAPAAAPARICHNLEQTAAAMGVGTHTVQAWLRRERDPLPHIRDGRRVLVPTSCWSGG